MRPVIPDMERGPYSKIVPDIVDMPTMPESQHRDNWGRRMEHLRHAWAMQQDSYPQKTDVLPHWLPFTYKV